MHSQKESNKIETLKKIQNEGKIVKEPKHVIHQKKGQIKPLLSESMTTA